MEKSGSPQSASCPLPDGKDYHAFICFNVADQEFVDETIVHLESPGIGLKCVDHRRDFHAGKTIIKNIEEFVERSWKYILIMSPAFVASDWCSFETDIMVNMSVEQREECIIPVLLKPCMIPKALKSLTYIDVSQSSNWRERMIQDIRRTDISSQWHKLPMTKMKEKVREAQQNMSVYQQCVDNYKREKMWIELLRKRLENDVNNAFQTMAIRLFEELDRQKAGKLSDINVHVDKCLADLVHKFDTAKKILALGREDLDDSALKTFTSNLDEYAKLETRLKERSFSEFVPSVSDGLVEKLRNLMSEFDVGYLREINITEIKSKENRANYLQEIAPSWAILPEGTEVTPWSLVRCPYFQFDPMTVWTDRSILPDGSLYNKSPSVPHPPSDRRLKTYVGAVGTMRFTSGSVYYWVNKVDVDIKKELGRKDRVFEVGLSTSGVYDEKHELFGAAGAVGVHVHRCKDHPTDSVCLKVFQVYDRMHHQTLYPNKIGHCPPLLLGFLLDTIRHRWTVFDVTKKEKITTLDGFGDVEEFTPMFGVYSAASSMTKLSLITGTDLKLSDEMYELILRELG